MTVSFQDVIFAFDCSRIETVGGVRYLWDYGPNGLHFAFPGGAADPTPQLDGSLSFDGGDYLALPAGRVADFYQKMPAGPYTLLFNYTANAAGSYFFSCIENLAPNWFGIAIGIEPVLGNTQVYNMIGNATLPRVVGTLSSSVARRRVAALTVETTPRHVIDQSLATAPTWTVGAFGAPSYSAIAPRIGGAAVVGIFNGTLRYFSIIRNAISSPDMAQLSAMLANGIKPFCWRQP